MIDDCVFCKIVRGEIPVKKIYEDEDTLVFLDAYPIMKGQTLVIPKKHIAPYLFDTDDKTYVKLMLVAKKIAKAIYKALNPIKTGLIIEGLELDHVHIKLFPLSNEGFKNISKLLNPTPSLEEMKDIAERIKKEIK